MYSCHDVFTDQFIFRTVRFGANLEYLLSPTNQSAKPTDLKKIIFAFSVNDATFSFLISLFFECVHSVVDIPFSREKLP